MNPEGITTTKAEIEALSDGIKALDKSVAESKKVKAIGELAALADTINTLNDEDAVELFKEMPPGASSFSQSQVSASAMKARALALVQGAHSSSSERRQALNVIALSLSFSARQEDRLRKDHWHG